MYYMPSYPIPSIQTASYCVYNQAISTHTRPLWTSLSNKLSTPLTIAYIYKVDAGQYSTRSIHAEVIIAQAGIIHIVRRATTAVASSAPMLCRHARTHAQMLNETSQCFTRTTAGFALRRPDRAYPTAASACCSGRAAKRQPRQECD